MAFQLDPGSRLSCHRSFTAEAPPGIAYTDSPALVHRIGGKN